jgi:hypothetical protein
VRAHGLQKKAEMGERARHGCHFPRPRGKFVHGKIQVIGWIPRKGLDARARPATPGAGVLPRERPKPNAQRRTFNIQRPTSNSGHPAIKQRGAGRARSSWAQQQGQASRLRINGMRMVVWTLLRPGTAARRGSVGLVFIFRWLVRPIPPRVFSSFPVAPARSLDEWPTNAILWA